MYKEILDSLKTEPIVFVDDQHIVRYMNDVAKRKFVKNPEEDLLGASIFNCHSEQSAHKIKEYFKEMQEGKIEQVHVRKKGHVQGIMQVVKNAEGKAIGYIERHELIVPEQVDLKENHYQKASEYYDLLFDNKPSKEVDFYLNQIGTGKKVLEIGCSTGRVGLALALAGNEVTGIDVSKELINVYNRKLIDAWEHISFPVKTITGDFKDFKTDKAFDYVILSKTAYQLLFSNPRRISSFKKAISFLKPGGQIIVSMNNPDLERLNNWAEISEITEENYNQCLDIHITRTLIGKRHFEKQQIVSYIHQYDVYKNDQVVESFKEPMREAYQFHEQVLNVVEQSGLTVAKNYGDWDKSLIDEKHSSMLIYILQI